MPNIGGPQTQKRKILLEVVHSTLLYGASVWADALRTKRYATMITSTQRKMLLRVACAYKTVSAAALQVITGTPPITLLVEERSRLDQMDTAGRTQAFRRRIREVLLTKWQNIWNRTTEVAGWTKELIPNIKDWYNCEHKILGYEMTQFLTGHGSFRSYTLRIGKEEESTCIYCPEPSEDTPEHTFMVCPRWSVERTQLRTSLVDAASCTELLARMVGNKDAWTTGLNFIKGVMTAKEREERERQGL